MYYLEYIKRNTPERAKEANPTSARNAMRREILADIKQMADVCLTFEEIGLDKEAREIREQYRPLVAWIVAFGITEEKEG